MWWLHAVYTLFLRLSTSPTPTSASWLCAWCTCHSTNLLSSILCALLTQFVCQLSPVVHTCRHLCRDARARTHARTHTHSHTDAGTHELTHTFIYASPSNFIYNLNPTTGRFWHAMRPTLFCFLISAVTLQLSQPTLPLRSFNFPCSAASLCHASAWVRVHRWLCACIALYFVCIHLCVCVCVCVWERERERERERESCLL